jgi:hypothetical protein
MPLRRGFDTDQNAQAFAAPFEERDAKAIT